MPYNFENSKNLHGGGGAGGFRRIYTLEKVDVKVCWIIEIHNVYPWIYSKCYRNYFYAKFLFTEQLFFKDYSLDQFNTRRALMISNPYNISLKNYVFLVARPLRPYPPPRA